VKKILAAILTIVSLGLSAQNFGNEWINYTQKYYQFKIAEDGLYRITYQDLLNANILLSTINPQNIQLFAKGQEIPIYIKGEADSVFNATDYIEFYAEGNDGWLDTVLYKGKENQPNPYYSLLNDTLTYYLSWNNLTNNLRYQEENAIDFSNYFPAPFVWKESVESYTTNYYDGEILSSQATDPEYVPTEGYMDAAINLGQSRNKVISTHNSYASGPSIEFEFKVAGASNWAGLNNGDHHLRITLGNFVYDRVFEGYQLIHLDTSLGLNTINNGNNIVRIQSIDDLSNQQGRVDRMALAYLRILYPHYLNFSSAAYETFLLDDSQSQQVQYLEIDNFNGGSQPLLYDVSNGKKIRVVQGVGNYRAIVPNGGGRKKIILSAPSQVKSVSSINPVGTNAQFVNYESQVSAPFFLMVTHSSLSQVATQYRAYRQSSGMEVLMVDIEQLYHQFGYGIPKSPLAIRNFVDQIDQNWTHQASHLFLLGKSVAAKGHRRNATAYQQNLVPTMGSPAADNLITAGLNNTKYEPLIPQGRLSAKNATDVRNYLDKLVEYESAPKELWMKQALHFAGGNTLFETNRFENYLNGFANDFAQAPFGGNAKTFRKSSSSPFQTSLSDSIRTLINNGVALMTFFGHASATGNFDISIDSPDKLNNRGKYPTILANSCFAGNYHQADVMSTGEAYVLEKNRGAIGFIANGNLGLPYPLSLYSGAFYEEMANTNYGAYIAENMRLAVKNIQNNFNDLSLKSVCLEMTLQGDPALKMYHADKPDYRTIAENVNISPGNLSTDLDSFFIQIQVDNIGRAVNDSLAIRLSHDFPQAGKSDTAYSRVVAPVYNSQTLQFRLPIDLIFSAGENRFSLLLDPLNQIDELSVLNNRLDFSVEIRAGEIVPVYPTDFAIVGNQSIQLKASTVYAFEDERTYVFELDTTSKFNSPLKESWTKVGRGGVLEWEPQLLQSMTNERVYYWRVSRQPQMGEQANWRTASFQYISGKSGWGQRHLGQYQKNSFQFLRLDENSRKFEYTDRNSELLVRTKGSPTIAETNEVLYALDADVRERSACGGTSGFLIAVLDSLTLESWQTPYMGENTANDFGQANLENYCAPDRSRSENYFLFRQSDSSQMLAMRDFLLNEIPTNNYVVAYTWFNVNYDNIWAQDSSILKAFEQLGSTEIRNLQNGAPFIFTVKKGKINSVNEVAGDSTNASIELRRNLTTSANFGDLNSTTIGPGSAWQKLTYQFSKEEANSADSLTVELSSVNAIGNRSIILTSNAFNLDSNINQLVPNDAVHLELRSLSSDEQQFTPPQLNYWQITYSDAPDLALSPIDFYELNDDTLEVGEPVEVKIAVRNNSQTTVQAFDLSVKLTNSTGQTKWDSTFTYNESLTDTFTVVDFAVPTNFLSGRQQIELELNPQRDFLETQYFNNQGQFSIFIQNDRLNPLLDVTFDGRHIMNGELVSAKPEIRLRLEDDNNYLAIEDTSSFSIFLRMPNGDEKLVNFEGDALGQLEFMPAKLPENVAEVRFIPNLTEDGVYRLRVQARDASGNASGANDYQVDFEVVNKSTVTRLLNYPNPFSTSTRFVFTLTGSQIPDQIQIQIMTITGKVVREIDQFELGPLHIGDNITDFAWDGRDEFGDQLANGIYLYRVKMRMNGSAIEHRESKADEFFTKEFGKMYLLR
jgi:hypothetical protein